MSWLRRDLRTIVVAIVAAAVTATVPALADSHFDAQNADKVDGRHAVGATATAGQRAGKLVAINGNGNLPNDIIAQAPDAERFDGVDSRKFKGLPLDVYGARIVGGANHAARGISLSPSEDGYFSFVFMYPQNRAAGEPAYVDLVFDEESAGACSIVIDGAGVSAPHNGEEVHATWPLQNSSGTGASGGAILTLPAGGEEFFTVSFRSNSPALARPGVAQQVTIRRLASTDAADTCGTITVIGARLRY